MKKSLNFIFMVILVVFLINSICAINIKVTKLSSEEVMIPDLNKPTMFNMSVTNLGPSTQIQFYNLLGYRMLPSEAIDIKGGETKDILLLIYPKEDIKTRGYYIMEYFIKGNDNTEISQKLTMEIIDLKDAFEIGAESIDPTSNYITVYIENTKNINFGEIKARISSPFFDTSQTFTLKPLEKITFKISIDKEDAKKLLAGYYTIKANLIFDNKKTTEIEGTINFIEKKIVASEQNQFGFIVNTLTVSKKNEGNIVADAQTVVKKNIISRLFTSFSPEPDIVDRKGLIINYLWARELNPGESLDVKVKTNWFLPVLILFFLAAVVVLVKKYTLSGLELKKTVSFVRTRGGEFAMKVTINAEAKEHIENITLIDRLPTLVKLHEGRGEKPLKIDEKNRKIEWNFSNLEKGEKRNMSYIIYSNLGIMGKFALPSAVAVFEQNGKIKETESNKAFLIAEQRTKDFVE